MSSFGRYSAYYDLLYRDKDYAAEAEYVARAIRASSPEARTILEFGSGSGRHGRLLAAMGFDVLGIERSSEMVTISQAVATNGPGSFICQAGDICATTLGRTFDAVISLFHVISYQTTNEALLAAFGVAASHLKSGGVFLFDVWHGPAVLTERPSQRVKEASDERHRVRRAAWPQLDANAGTVAVRYDVECEDRDTGEHSVFAENHVMRYLFPTEIDFLARATGFAVAGTEEFLTGRPPSQSTWGVSYILRK